MSKNFDLDLPDRIGKPRTNGINMILEKGKDLHTFSSFVEDFNANIDYLKFTSGIGIIDSTIDKKIELCFKYGITPYFGGTLFEKYYIQGKLDNYIALLNSKNLKCIEISDGTIEISEDDKVNLIKKFSKIGFEVLVEIGSKDTDYVMPPSKWLSQMNTALDAGAKYLIMEGRESGSAGLYRTSGEIRTGLLEEICNNFNTESVIFEAPNKKSQCYMINKLGANVNLGNIKLEELNILEVQRIGLRYETFNAFNN